MGCVFEMTIDYIDIIRIDSLRTVDPNGNANPLMRYLCDLADEYGVMLCGFAKPFAHYRLVQGSLIRWYAFHGFQDRGKIEGLDSHGHEIERPPKDWWHGRNTTNNHHRGVEKST